MNVGDNRLPLTAKLLLPLELFQGITAIGGGAMLALRPDGSLIRMPIEWLRHSPFESYLIPGLVLAIVVGGSALVAAAFIVLRRSNAWFMSAVAGSGVVIWIVVQLAMTRMFHPLQIVYLVTGAAILILAFLLRRGIAR